ncbi:MAG TPA: FlgD immunoglobulin-like domain containing protein, partial [Candidatus Cloacimonas acidaminovorans]|nr:FlgD immunoglobulin-like domain containing protein [Candidatus Cloacimonas acidaminovorans]
GTSETDGTYVKNVAAGVQTATFSNLNSSTTYYFKIFPYTNSGTYINYKTDGTIPQISWTTASGPTIVEIILPQYIQGKNGTNNQRLPWACRLRLENLTANATYRYFGQFVVSTDDALTNGAGNCWFVNSDNTITRNTTLGMSTAGTYSEFTTNANGSYTGWFIGEPTANVRFAPGNKLYYRIMLNDGAGGTSVAMRLTTANFIKVINFGTEDNVDQGTFLYGVSRSPAKNFVFVYDNVEGTGRPIAGSIIENDGLNLSSVTSILASYRTNVDNVAGAWGVIIPNSVGTKGFSGIKRIESRNLSDGSLYAQATDSDGVWPSGANTVNPRGGDGTPIVLNENDATLPVELSSFTANINSQGGITVMWATQSETGVNGYYINRATVNNLSEALRISSLIPASNTSQQQVYVYNDNELYEPGTYYYWLEIQDIDGVVSYYGSRSVTFGGNGNNGTPEIPLVTGIRSIYPNPFNPSATIMYELDQPANVNIEIYNNRGQIVRSFNLGQQEKNRYKLLWDGTDNSGSACGTGIYFVKMQAGKETFLKKAALVK